MPILSRRTAARELGNTEIYAGPYANRKEFSQGLLSQVFLVWRTWEMNAVEIPLTSLSLMSAMRSQTKREAGWIRFVSTYQPLLRYWLKPYGLQDVEVDDLLGMVFLKVFQCFSSYDRKRGAFRTWLRAILKHAMLDEIRRRQRRPGDQPHGGSASLDRLEQVAETGMDSLANDMRQLLAEQDRILDAIKSRVGEKTWQAFWRMRIREETSAAEVGKDLGMTINAVHQAAHRVANLLREEGTRKQFPPVDDRS